MKNIILLLAAMIGSGVLGGGANYLLLHKDDPAYAKRSRSFVLGLVAALLAPLFLKTISSEMVEKISSIQYGSGIPFDFFVFTSFCLLTALFSRTFAETVAKRLATEVEKARRESEEAQLRAMVAEEKAREAAQDSFDGTLPRRLDLPPAGLVTVRWPAGHGDWLGLEPSVAHGAQILLP